MVAEESGKFVRDGRLGDFAHDEMKERAKIQCEVIKALLLPMASSPEWNDAFREMAEDFSRFWDSTEPKDRTVSSAIAFVNEAKISRILDENGK